MKIPSFVWILAVLILGGGFLILLSNSKGDSVVANSSIPVQVEVFADYNCSHCADFEPYLEKVQNTFGAKVNLQSKHLPFLAPSSADHAYAAEAARLQNKFNEFNHDLFAWISYKRDPANTSYSYSEDDIAFYSQDLSVTLLAERLSLDVNKFEEDRKSSAIISLVQSQKSDAIRRLGTTATPTVFISGVKFDLKTYDDLQNKVQEIINKIEGQK